MRSSKTIAFAALAVVLVAGSLLSTGCRRVPIQQVEGEVSHDTYELESGTAKDAQVSMKMGVGELDVRSDAATGTLMSARFDYRPDKWKPTVDVNVDDADGTSLVEVSQPNVEGFSFRDRLKSDLSSMKNRWTIALSPEIPTDLDVELGAGEADLSLGDSLLRSLALKLGAGDVTVDLSGEWKNDLSADIEAGVGQLTIVVPEDAGVRIRGGQEGVGDFTVEGLTKDGDAYVNDAYGKSDVTLDIVLQRGVGDVRVRTAR